MKNLLFLVLISMSSVVASAQRSLSFNMYELLQKEDVKSSPVQFENQYSGILGSAFLTEDWTSGRAFTMMKLYPLKKMRFDVHKNKVYINNNDTIYDISGTGIVQFDIYPIAGDTTTKMSFNNGYSVEEITPDKYVQVFSEGKIEFIKYYIKEIEEVYVTSPTYKEKKFIDKNKYYIIEDGKDGKEVTVSKKNLEKILAARWDEVSKYAKSSGASMNREDGWKKLIDYYNALP